MAKRKNRGQSKTAAKATDAPPAFNPFKAMKTSLREMVQERAAPEPPPAPVRPPPPELDDAQLFAQEMAQVSPLKRRGAKRSRPLRPVDERPKRERFVDAESEFAAMMEEEVGDHWRGPGVGEGELDDLRLGRMIVQKILDLHGLREDAAQRAVRAFVANARMSHLVCLLIVHGQGLHSGSDGPVLRAATRRWLRSPPLSADVRAWSSALPDEGGPGGTRVLLRQS